MLLTDVDIGALAAHRGLSERDFIERYARLASNRAQLSLRDGPDGACVFYGEQGCGVYPARPAQCRTFPLGWTVRGGCPGLREERPAMD